MFLRLHHRSAVNLAGDGGLDGRPRATPAPASISP